MNERSYKNYLLVVLVFVAAFNNVDRLALAIVMQDVKTDLSLSDTQLGFVTGIAFFLFYAVMGIPIARWADRGNRVTIIASCTVLWSAALALCGAVANFVQLLLVRIGVAVGEAGCVPPAHSLIADHFSREDRPRALAIFMLNAPLAALLGYFLAGWLNELYGWRMTFVLLGLPGIVLALLTALTLREPRSKKQWFKPAELRRNASPEQHATLREVCVTLWSNATFRHLLFAYAVISLFANGISQWHAAFFIRSYGLGTGEVGTWFTLIYGGLGVVGTYLGGFWASRYAARNERLQLKAAAMAYSVFGLLSPLIYFSPNAYWAMALSGLAAIGIYAMCGPLFAIIQTLVPEQMRATAVALILLFVSFIGAGLGPLAAGMLSDAFQSGAGNDSLRYALVALSPGYLWGAWHYWRAGKTITRDLSRGENVD
jgi:MFS transporter, Spinster family, sphingosine-1-phosphate transporter